MRRSENFEVQSIRKTNAPAKGRANASFFLTYRIAIDKYIGAFYIQQEEKRGEYCGRFYYSTFSVYL